MRKFQLLDKEHEELKLKIESITKINNSLETKLSTSCIDSSDESNPYNEKCFEDVVVESCDDLITKENDELKQEVQRLMKDLARLKEKGIESHVQHSQDNCDDMVKKLEKGSTVTCFKCHQEGHKSNKCPQLNKIFSDEYYIG